MAKQRTSYLTWNLSSNNLTRCLLKVCSLSSERLASWLDWDTSCVMKRAAASISSFIVAIEFLSISWLGNRLNTTRKKPTGNSRVLKVQYVRLKQLWLKVFQQLGYYTWKWDSIVSIRGLVFYAPSKKEQKNKKICKCVTKSLRLDLISTLLNSHNVLSSDAR